MMNAEMKAGTIYDDVDLKDDNSNHRKFASKEVSDEDLKDDSSNHGKVSRKEVGDGAIQWGELTMKEDVVLQGTTFTMFRALYYDQNVAVKVIDFGKQQPTEQQKDSLKKFHQEVSVWNKLEHPNIIKFIGASEYEDNLYSSSGNLLRYVVAEYLPGGTLKSYLKKNSKKKLPLKIVVRLALDLAGGVSYIHSKKILHRNIRSDRMLLDENHRLKIANFGVACLQCFDQTETPEQVVGTLGYMAPEVLEGKAYDSKVDVYSFGICLWEMYCCDIPFDPSKFEDVTAAMANKDLRPEIPDHCPEPLAEIMKSCWSADPTERPEMKDVVSRLEKMENSLIEDTRQPQCICFLPRRKH